MGTILLGWELGGGLGHVTSLLEVARGLAEHGHTPVLALQDIAGALPALRGSPFRVVQAPFWTGPVPTGFRASTYADILAIRGFAEADGLGRMVDAWQALIEWVSASLVVCDHAPTLCLAALDAVPTVLVSNGFAIPPASGREFPVLDPKAHPAAGAEQVLAVVAEVQGLRGRQVPESLPGALAGSARFIRTIEELDPYRGERRGEVVGLLHAPPRVMPPPEGGAFFAYLAAEYPGVDQILPYLAGAGFRGSAYVRGGPAGLVEAARRAGLKIHDTPPPLHEVLAGAAAIVHHGSLGTATAALAAGRPQVALPLHLEHELTSAALERLGVGHSMTGRFPVEAIGAALRGVMEPGGCPERAGDVARSIQARHGPGCLPSVIARCRGWLE